MTENNVSQILDKLPSELAEAMQRLPEEALEELEEIRVRRERPILVYAGGIEYVLELSSGKGCSQAAVDSLFHCILNHSAYAYQDQLASGYITIEGGHRVGVCGRVVMEKGRGKSVKDISSLNIRRSRQLPGIAASLIPLLLDSNGRFCNTILISPPKCGKTTLLRDVIRQLSHRGLTVGVCDERSEIGGTFGGQAAYDLGPRTDILDSCPKQAGIPMLIRSMAPDVIATDEIGRREDGEAIEAAVCAGVSLLTTIHGASFDDLLSSGIGGAVRHGVFQRFVFLSNQPRIGTISEIRKWKGAVS